MVIQSRKICNIELDAKELAILGDAADILQQIINIADEEDVRGFKIADYAEYTENEISDCMCMLNDLSTPIAKLTGYFCERSK